MFSVHIKTKYQRLQILVLRAFSKTSGFRDGLVWTVGLTVERKLRFRKAPFSRRISVDGRTNRRDKAAVLKSSVFDTD